jgi:arabinose-5-phosphate isomerase
MTASDADIAATAARVLGAEAAAVQALADRLPDGFVAAVRLVLGTTGRVVVSGMGKSGHVGRKIAATLASTGTPALFVHPAEASHGDLGMVTPGDCCILLSNSGETVELRDLIAHCARFAIPVVAVSRVEGSSLMRAATVPLLLPDAPEACGFGMAPTTSTTLQLALGDALAVAVMEARRFRPDQFRSYHPGGRLGAQLSEVHQIMHRGDAVPVVPRDMGMPEVILVMTAKGFGLAGLVDDAGLLAGVISDGDLRRNLDGLMGRTAAQVANRAPVTVAPDMLAAEALRVMNSRKIGALFVVERGRPVGIVHLHDLLRAGVA